MNFFFLPSSALLNRLSANRMWFRHLLSISLVVCSVLSAMGQTKWTQQIQTRPSNYLTDVAYGAGRYVAVGDAGLVRVSTDAVAWKTQVAGSTSPLGAPRLSTVIYAKNLFVAVGSSGQIITSVDGLTWLKRASGTGENLNAIAYGGGLFMAVGTLGTAISSADGIHWTTLTTGTTNDLNDLVYANNRFVVVGDDGMIRTTPNGMIWTEQQSGTDKTLSAIAASPTGNLMVIGLFDIVLTSTNGITWVKYENPIYPAGEYIYYIGIFHNPKTGKFVINIGGPAADRLTSLDGKNWTASSTDSEIPLIMVRYLNGQFIGVGAEGHLGYSSSGDVWRWTILDKDVSLYGAAYGNGRYVAVGEYPSEENRSLRSNVALTSVDGQHYGVGETTHLVGGAKCFNDVAFGAGLFAAVGEDAIIQTSVDGKVWGYSSVNFGQTLRGITYGGGWFVAVGDKGYFVRSVDGKTWIKSYMGLSHQYNSVAYANGLFVAVGENGALAISSNGFTWYAMNTNTNSQIKSVAFGNGMWVAVGYDGLVCWSLDGAIWKHYTADPTARFNHIVFANNQFVAVSLDGKLYTSPTPFGWTTRSSTVTSHLYGLVHGPDQFVAVGVAGTIITSPDDRERYDVRGRQGLAEVEVELQAVAYPNPIEKDFSVTIEGASGQPVRLWLVDLQGRTIADRTSQVGDSSHQESMSLDNHAPGTYLLRVSTPSQTKTIKLLKQ